MSGTATVAALKKHFTECYAPEDLHRALMIDSGNHGDGRRQPVLILSNENIQNSPFFMKRSFLCYSPSAAATSFGVSSGDPNTETDRPAVFRYEIAAAVLFLVCVLLVIAAILYKKATTTTRPCELDNDDKKTETRGAPAAADDATSLASLGSTVSRCSYSLPSTPDFVPSPWNSQKRLDDVNNTDVQHVNAFAEHVTTTRGPGPAVRDSVVTVDSTLTPTPSLSRSFSSRFRFHEVPDFTFDNRMDETQLGNNGGTVAKCNPPTSAERSFNSSTQEELAATLNNLIEGVEMTELQQTAAPSVSTPKSNSPKPATRRSKAPPKPIRRSKVIPS